MNIIISLFKNYYKMLFRTHGLDNNVTDVYPQTYHKICILVYFENYRNKETVLL